MKLKPKRLLSAAALTACFGVVGAVGGVVYPYTELIFNHDLSQRQRDRHTDTLMTDNGDQAWKRAGWGAVYLGGICAMFLTFRAFRKPTNN